MTYWYRYDSHPRTDGATVNLNSYQVTKETPKGVWLEGRRFVLRGARKRFACPTVEEAAESFVARKRRQINILRAQLRHAEAALATAESGFKPEVVEFEWVNLDETQV